MRKIKAILFDLDGTLYDHEKARTEALQKLVRVLPQKVEFRPFLNTYNKVIHELRRQHEDMSIFNKEKVFGLVISCLNIRSNGNLIRKLASSYWNELLKRVEPYDDAKLTLETLKTLGYKMAVVSDGLVKIQLRKLDHMKLKDLFDAYAFSEEVGINKPNTAVFKLALKRLKVKPSEAVMIGDDLELDLAGAKMLGLKAILIKHRKAEPRISGTSIQMPDFMIRKLEELTGMLKTLQS